jgi:plasmid stability protein
MKTTLDLPDDLARAVKLRALQDGREVEDIISDVLSANLLPAKTAMPEVGQTVSKNLPMIKVRPAQPSDASSMTTQEWCDWLKDVDLQLEVERYEKALGHQHVDRANP